MKTFPFTVIHPANEHGVTPRVFNIKIRIDVTPDTNPQEVLQYIRSFAIKQELERGWMAKHAPNYGLEIRGGPVPITQDPKNLSSPVVAYEQEFRLCQRL